MCPGSCRPCRGFHFDQAAEIALDFAFISLESCTGTGGIRLQPPTHCTASTISSSSGSCSFCCYPSLAHSPSQSLSLLLSPSLSVWFRKLSFCSSSPKRKSYFLLLCTLLFRLSPFPRTPTLSLSHSLSLLLTVSFCLPLARKQFGCNFCAKFMLFVPFVPRIWALFASAPCIRLTSAPPPLPFPLPTFASFRFHRYPCAFYSRKWVASLLLSVCVCAYVRQPHQVVFMASALRVLMKELASVIQSVSMSGCHLPAIETQRGLRAAARSTGNLCKYSLAAPSLPLSVS